MRLDSIGPATPPASRGRLANHFQQVVDGRRFTVAIQRGADASRGRVEAELSAAGLELPLYHSLDWARLGDADESWFVVVRDGAGKAAAAFAVDVSHSRALPGHRLLHVQRLGTAFPPAALHAGLASLRDLARAHGRVLRLDVEVFSRSETTRAEVADALAALGFRPRPMRLYAETVAVDLAPDEADIFASLHATARRHVRAVAKHPVEVRTIDDPDLGDRMNALLRETMERTGGGFVPEDWRRTTEFCAANPERARLVGLFRTDLSGPESLVAYTLGLSHGEHVEYLTAASTRDPALRIPLAYPLAWDLIRWAKSVGARWFDFGGVTPGGHGSGDDPTGGISDFKRYFSRDVVRVAEDWSYEPHPVRAALARRVSSGADWLRGMR